MLQDNSRRYVTFAAPTIINCKYYYILLLWRRTIEISIQDGGLIKGQKNAHHHTHTKYLVLMLLQTRLFSRWSLPLREFEIQIFKFFFRFSEVRKNGGGRSGADGGGRSGLPGGHPVRQGDA
jgi:hypothetical protein